MLMMAIETTLDPQDRDEATSAHVRELLSLTREVDLPNSQKQSLLGSLEWMLQESISQSGRRLAASLTGRTYMNQTPQKFFTTCYELRSRLVHGATPRPDFDSVNIAAAQLELGAPRLVSYHSVKGHWESARGGHENCPVVATRSARCVATGRAGG